MVNILVGQGSVQLVSIGDSWGELTENIQAKRTMDVLKKLVTWGIKFLRYLLVHVLISGLLDLLIFDRINRIINDLFEGEGGAKDWARDVGDRSDAIEGEGGDARGRV